MSTKFVNGRARNNKFYTALGGALAQMRHSEGLEVKEMSKIMDIGDGYYRIIESGNGSIKDYHILKLLTSRVGSMINYISFSTLLSAINTIIESPEKNEAACIEQLICAVPPLKILLDLGDDKNKNCKIFYKFITNNLEYEAGEFVDSVTDAIINTLGPKIRSTIKEEVKFYNK